LSFPAYTFGRFHAKAVASKGRRARRWKQTKNALCGTWKNFFLQFIFDRQISVDALTEVAKRRRAIAAGMPLQRVCTNIAGAASLPRLPIPNYSTWLCFDAGTAVLHCVLSSFRDITLLILLN
jgi:hypothetical protein